MATRFDLREFLDVGAAPALQQSRLSLQREDLRQQQGQEEMLAQRAGKRAFFDVPSQQAARGAFFSGTTGRKLGRDVQDIFTPTLLKSRAEATNRITDLIRNQFMSTLGVQL